MSEITDKTALSELELVALLQLAVVTVECGLETEIPVAVVGAEVPITPAQQPVVRALPGKATLGEEIIRVEALRLALVAEVELVVQAALLHQPQLAEEEARV
jgi:hypothetical protein